MRFNSNQKNLQMEMNWLESYNVSWLKHVKWLKPYFVSWLEGRLLMTDTFSRRTQIPPQLLL